VSRGGYLILRRTKMSVLKELFEGFVQDFKVGAEIEAQQVKSFEKACIDREVEEYRARIKELNRKAKELGISA
jgi:hypothetical protein